VASHAELDPSNPLFSAIAFAPHSTALDDDGRFELHELLGMAVSSPLVFLSGCETGLGPAGSTSFARGEDYATLAQAVLYAGARNVVATLWRVEDDGGGGVRDAVLRAAPGGRSGDGAGTGAARSAAFALQRAVLLGAVRDRRRRWVARGCANTARRVRKMKDRAL
jgi:hypothetical protein